MCDPENLIMCVQKHPCIWDINSADYHNKDVKDLTWEQICKEIFNDWRTCTDKANKCADAKKKWTNIRDYYRKEIRKLRNVTTGSAAKRPKKYVYADLLHFLTPIFATRGSEGNYPNEDSHCIQPQIQSETEGKIEAEDINEECPVTTPTPIPLNVKKRKEPDVPTQILNVLQHNQKTPMTSNDAEDDDTKFLLSFRSDLKNMNADQKIDFKIGMLQLVRKINMGNYPSSSRPPTQF